MSTVLAMIGLAITAWWFNSARPAGEPVRAGLSLPDLSELPWSQQPWNRLFDPLRAQLFRLSSVDFAGLDKLTAAELAGSLDLASVALIDVDPAQICSRLLAAHPRIATCSAARMPPARLVVAVTERAPLAAVHGTGTGIDADGTSFVLAPGEETELPRLVGDVPTALRVLRAAIRAGVALGAVDARSPRDVVTQPLGTPARLRIGADVERSLQRWHALLKAMPLAQLGSVEVDARFRGQVVLREHGAAQDPIQARGRN
jgi:hypothetical protein